MSAVAALLLILPVATGFLRESWAPAAWAAIWLVGAAAVAAYCLARGIPISGTWTVMALAAMPAFGVGQLLSGSTAHRAATQLEVLVWTALALLFVACRSLFMDAHLRERFLDFALAAGGLIALLSLLQFLTSAGRIYWWIPTEADAVLGPFRNRNHYAAWIELVFPLALIRGLKPEPWAAAVASVMAASVVVGGSRAGIALIAAETLALIVLARPVPAAAFAFAFAPFRDFGRRDDLYFSSLEIIQQRPLTGHGLGTFERVYPAYARFDNGLIVDHAHNDWLEWAAEAGVFPVAMLAAAAIWSARAGCRHPWALGVPAVFLHSLVDYPLHKPAIAAWTFVMLAALSAADAPAED